MKNQSVESNSLDKFENTWIIFIFPYKGIGGVSTLFLKLAEIISNKHELKIGVVDYKDGFMSKNLETNKKLKFFEYSDSQILHLPEDAYLVFQSMTPWSIFRNLKFKNNQNLFFWNLHPFNLLVFFPFFRKYFEKNLKLSIFVSKTLLFFYRKKIFNFINILYKKKSIFFMDDCNYSVTKRFYNLTIKKRLLPIGTIIPERNLFSLNENINDNEINAGWLGRAVGFKESILLKILKDLNEFAFAENTKINFIIISDQIDNLDLSSFKNINIKFIGNINPKELSKVVSLNLDIFFAMGLSAFEVASMGIPTVLLDFSYAKIPDSYRYKFLFESDKYSAGELISNHSKFLGKTMFEILKEIQKKDNSLSLKTYKFTKDNHNIEIIAEKFLSFLFQSSAKYEDFSKKNILKGSMTYTITNLIKNKK